MAERFETPYEDYDVLTKWGSPSWDDQTRRVVSRRLHEVPRREFLESSEWTTLEAVCARLIPQPDRRGSPVPIVPFIDQTLVRDQGIGYRYEGMPGLRTAWRLGIQGIEREARQRHDRAYTELAAEQQDAILRVVQEGAVRGGPWDDLPPQLFFTEILLRTVVGIYYAHPAAWSETGFGGPASPRGYVRRGIGEHDAWEADESWNPTSSRGPTSSSNPASPTEDVP